ncbi:MAG: hypothetical protein IPM63_17885 [Acidobacteriota bacterium]|nr:MAG: hypothetical protein IPM63_17885 [Acidobacteriota bacterium]
MLAKTFFFIISAALFLNFSGCGSEESPSDRNTADNVSNAASPSNALDDDPLGGIEKTPTPAEKVEAVTLKPVVAAYCDAMRKKDEAGLRKVYSAATIRSFEASMREEGVSSLAEYLSTEPVGAKCEVVNERIQGNLGEALVTTETYPNGIMIKFVKEGGEWKMTNQSSDFDAVRKDS